MKIAQDPSYYIYIKNNKKIFLKYFKNFHFIIFLPCSALKTAEDP